MIRFRGLGIWLLCLRYVFPLVSLNGLANGQIARDDNNLSKGYGFVSFGDFESSDAAIADMNGQYLMNKQVSVQYAYKKDGKGERHGDQAERMLASQARKHNVRPPTQPLPPQFSVPGTPMMPAMPNGAASRPMSTGPPGSAPPVGFQNVPPSQSRPPPPATSLATPPPGLPARPPPSQAGYGGPQGFMQPGFGNDAQQPGFPPGGGPPGFGPPPGFQPGFGR